MNTQNYFILLMTKLKIVIYGVLGRSLRFTHQNHIEKIFKPLKKAGIQYSICYINNNIGNETIDGLPQDTNYMKIVGDNNYIELQQRLIDNKIEKLYPNYKNMFEAPNPKLHGLNPLRNSYIETCVAEYLASQDRFQKCIVFCSDCFFGSKISMNHLNECDDHIICSDHNPARGGYTNGFYIGSSINIPKLISTFYRLSEVKTINYEGLLKQNALQFDLKVKQVNFRFIKIKNNKKCTYMRPTDPVHPKVINIIKEYQNHTLKSYISHFLKIILKFASKFNDKSVRS